MGLGCYSSSSVEVSDAYIRVDIKVSVDNIFWYARPVGGAEKSYHHGNLREALLGTAFGLVD